MSLYFVYCRTSILPTTLSECAQATELKLQSGSDVTFVYSGDEIVFKDPGVNKEVILTMTYNWDSFHLPDSPCPGCQRQLLFSVDGVAHACHKFWANTIDSFTLSVNYISDGSFRNILTRETLNYECADVADVIPDNIIGYISIPTSSPTVGPTMYPTHDPTYDPTHNPSTAPTNDPTHEPTHDPTYDPTLEPTTDPTVAPTLPPTLFPTHSPTKAPVIAPTFSPTIAPSITPTLSPTVAPSVAPTYSPTVAPTLPPTLFPTHSPTKAPSDAPSYSPSSAPTARPTLDAMVKEETTNTIMITDEFDSNVDGRNNSSVIAANAATIIYSLGVLLVLSCCLLVLFGCYSARNRRKESGNTVMIKMKTNPQGEGVQLADIAQLQLPALPNNTQSVILPHLSDSSSGDEDESDSLFDSGNKETDGQHLLVPNNVPRHIDDDDDDDDDSDDLYEVNEPKSSGAITEDGTQN